MGHCWCSRQYGVPFSKVSAVCISATPLGFLVAYSGCSCTAGMFPCFAVQPMSLSFALPGNYLALSASCFATVCTRPLRRVYSWRCPHSERVHGWTLSCWSAKRMMVWPAYKQALCPAWYVHQTRATAVPLVLAVCATMRQNCFQSHICAACPLWRCQRLRLRTSVLVSQA